VSKVVADAARRLVPESPWAFRPLMLFFGLYFALFAVHRLAVSPGLSIDDGIETVHTQILAWGYDPEQPPLYTWLLWGAQRLMGAGLATSLALKYLFLLATLALCYLGARRVLADDRYAALATLSLLVIPPVGQLVHEIYTHTLPLMVLCMAGLLVFLRLIERGAAADYALLGAVFGLGLLSKYSFVAFIPGLLAAGLAQPAIRRRVLAPGMVVTTLVAAVIVAPYAAWLVAGGADLPGVYTANLAPEAAADIIASRARGLAQGAQGVFEFLWPIAVPVAILFPAILSRRRAAATGDPAAGGADHERLLRDMLLVGLVILVLGLLLSGATVVKGRWLHPFLIVAPIYLLARVRRCAPPLPRLRLFAAALVIALAGYFVFRAVQLTAGPPLCGGQCADLAPTLELAGGLAKAGFSQGTIVSGSSLVAAAVRLRFPGARVLSPLALSFRPPIDRARALGQCLMVWEHQGGALRPPDKILDLAGNGQRGALEGSRVGTVQARWGLPFRGADDPISTWAFILVEGGEARCR